MSDIVERLRAFWGDVSNRDIVEAADEIERLRALFSSDGEQHAAHIKGLNETHEARVNKLSDEIERLREALRPFARAADQLDKEMWDDFSIEGSLAEVTGSHCRAARAALEEKR